MKYSEFKEKVKAGDLIACSHQPWQNWSDVESHIVRMACESEFSHVSVVTSTVGEPCVVEAVVPAITTSPVTKYLDYGFYWIPTDVPMSDKEWDYALSKIGEEYSKLEAIAGFMDLLNIGGDEFWQCSELTIAMRRLSGLDLGLHATPAAVVKRALALGYSMQFVSKD